MMNTHRFLRDCFEITGNLFCLKKLTLSLCMRQRVLYTFRMLDIHIPIYVVFTELRVTKAGGLRPCSLSDLV